MMDRKPSVALVLVLILLAIGVSCGKVTFYSARADTDQQSGKAQVHGATTAASGLTRDLSKDQAAGGHTLSRHVGRTDEELRERLQHEHISAASTYTDRASAEQAVGAAIAANAKRIGDWVASSRGHPNLVLDYDSPQPIGRSLRRGQSHSTPCSHALIVLKWRPPADYFVLTSYPDCR